MSAQLRRQWSLVRALRLTRGALSVRELSKQFGVSKSTIERDLADLGEVFPMAEVLDGAQRRLYHFAHDPFEEAPTGGSDHYVEDARQVQGRCVLVCACGETAAGDSWVDAGGAMDAHLRRGGGLLKEVA